MTTDVISTICSRLETFSKAERALANYIIKDPAGAASMTVREIAEASGASPSAASRFARTLGFDSYAALRTALAVSLVASQGSQVVPSADDMPSYVARILENKVAELQSTADALDYANLERAVHAIINADTVLIAAVGNTITVGMNAAFKLQQTGVRAYCPAEPGAMAMAALNLTKNDVVLVLSTRGGAERLVPIVDAAQDAAAPIIMVTANPDAQLARRANIILRTFSRDGTLVNLHSFSHNSMNFIIEVLFLCTVITKEDSSAHALLLTNQRTDSNELSDIERNRQRMIYVSSGITAEKHSEN